MLSSSGSPVWLELKVPSGRRKLTRSDAAGNPAQDGAFFSVSAPSRHPHSGRASAGSQLQLQDLVNDRSAYLHSLLREANASFRDFSGRDPEWVSPLAADDYSEYQDAAFLGALCLERLASDLRRFWPRRGPVWDGLARIRSASGEDGVLLVEAKSHVKENAGPTYACGARGASLERITAQL